MNLVAEALFENAYTAFSAVVACSGTGSEKSRDPARGCSFLASPRAVLIFFAPSFPLGAAPLVWPLLGAPSAGPSALVMTPALRIALSPLASPAATAGPARASDAATGTPRVNRRMRREGIGAP